MLATARKPVPQRKTAMPKTKSVNAENTQVLIELLAESLSELDSKPRALSPAQRPPDPKSTGILIELLAESLTGLEARHRGNRLAGHRGRRRVRTRRTVSA
jgi:hypothetical protein